MVNAKLQGTVTWMSYKLLKFLGDGELRPCFLHHQDRQSTRYIHLKKKRLLLSQHHSHRSSSYCTWIWGPGCSCSRLYSGLQETFYGTSKPAKPDLVVRNSTTVKCMDLALSCTGWSWALLFSSCCNLGHVTVFYVFFCTCKMRGIMVVRIMRNYGVYTWWELKKY